MCGRSIGFGEIRFGNSTRLILNGKILFPKFGTGRVTGDTLPFAVLRDNLSVISR